jgi:tetratricopeptide (TPR) repeat protein
MTFRDTRLSAALLALFLAFGIAATARAADDDTPVSVLIGDAVAEYDAGHFQEARALFRQAHEKQPSARTLRGIGMCSFELRDYVEAARNLAASLREQRRPLTAEQKRHADALLTRANTFIGRFTIKMKPENSSLFVDGHPAELEPEGLLLLSFGRHQLSLRCASCAPAEKDEDVDVAGGEHKTIELVLAPAPPPPPGDTSGAGTAGTGTSGASGGTIVAQPGDHNVQPESGHAHIWFTGAAIAAALGAGGSAIYWSNRQHELDTCRNGETATLACTSESTISTQRKAAIGLTIGLGAAAVISGVAAGLMWPHAESSTATTTVACVPTNNMVSCAFRF